MSRFDLERIVPPPDPDLICPICQSVLDVPKVTPCQHVFCVVCIERWLSTRNTCPTCRATVTKTDLKAVLPLVQNVLNRLQITCLNQASGCTGTIALENYHAHKDACPFEKMRCRYARCNAELLRRDKSGHEKNCLYREVRCRKKCGLMIAIREMVNHDCYDALRAKIVEQDEQLSNLRQEQQRLQEEVQRLRGQLDSANRDLADMNRDYYGGDYSNDSWESWRSDYSATGSQGDWPYSPSSDVDQDRRVPLDLSRPANNTTETVSGSSAEAGTSGTSSNAASRAEPSRTAGSGYSLSDRGGPTMMQDMLQELQERAAGVLSSLERLQPATLWIPALRISTAQRTAATVARSAPRSSTPVQASPLPPPVHSPTLSASPPRYRATPPASPTPTSQLGILASRTPAPNSNSRNDTAPRPDGDARSPSPLPRDSDRTRSDSNNRSPDRGQYTPTSGSGTPYTPWNSDYSHTPVYSPSQSVHDISSPYTPASRLTPSIHSVYSDGDTEGSFSATSVERYGNDDHYNDRSRHTERYRNRTRYSDEESADRYSDWSGYSYGRNRRYSDRQGHRSNDRYNEQDERDLQELFSDHDYGQRQRSRRRYSRNRSGRRSWERSRMRSYSRSRSRSVDQSSARSRSESPSSRQRRGTYRQSRRRRRRRRRVRRQTQRSQERNQENSPARRGQSLNRSRGNTMDVSRSSLRSVERSARNTGSNEQSRSRAQSWSRSRSRDSLQSNSASVSRSRSREISQSRSVLSSRTPERSRSRSVSSSRSYRASRSRSRGSRSLEESLSRSRSRSSRERSPSPSVASSRSSVHSRSGSRERAASSERPRSRSRDRLKSPSVERSEDSRHSYSSERSDDDENSERSFRAEEIPQESGEVKSGGRVSSPGSQNSETDLDYEEDEEVDYDGTSSESEAGEQHPDQSHHLTQIRPSGHPSMDVSEDDDDYDDDDDNDTELDYEEEASPSQSNVEDQENMSDGIVSPDQSNQPVDSAGDESQEEEDAAPKEEEEDRSAEDAETGMDSDGSTELDYEEDLELSSGRASPLQSSPRAGAGAGAGVQSAGDCESRQEMEMENVDDPKKEEEEQNKGQGDGSDSESDRSSDTVTEGDNSDSEVDVTLCEEENEGPADDMSNASHGSDACHSNDDETDLDYNYDSVSEGDSREVVCEESNLKVTSAGDCRSDNKDDGSSSSEEEEESEVDVDQESEHLETEEDEDDKEDPSEGSDNCDSGNSASEPDYSDREPDNDHDNGENCPPSDGSASSDSSASGASDSEGEGGGRRHARDRISSAADVDCGMEDQVAEASRSASGFITNSDIDNKSEPVAAEEADGKRLRTESSCPTHESSQNENSGIPTQNFSSHNTSEHINYNQASSSHNPPVDNTELSSQDEESTVTGPPERLLYVSIGGCAEAPPQGNGMKDVFDALTRMREKYAELLQFISELENFKLPFYVREVLQDLLDEGVIHVLPSSWDLKPENVLNTRWTVDKFRGEVEALLREYKRIYSDTAGDFENQLLENMENQRSYLDSLYERFYNSNELDWDTDDSEAEENLSSKRRIPLESYCAKWKAKRVKYSHENY